MNSFSLISASIWYCRYMKPKVVEVGLGVEEGESLPSIQHGTKTCFVEEKRLWGEPPRGSPLLPGLGLQLA